MSHPSTLRAAHARLAAILRWRPDDAAAVQQAKRDLVVAQAAALTSEATALSSSVSLSIVPGWTVG